MKKKNCPVCNRKDLDCLYCDDCGKVPIDFQTPAKQPTVNDELVKEIDEMIRNLIQGEYHYDSDLPPLLTKCKTALSQVKPSVAWKPASEAPYDTMCLFYTIDGNVVQGFIYDGDEKDFGYTHYMQLPAAPEADLIETIEK